MEKGNEYPQAVEERLHLFADQDREANAGQWEGRCPSQYRAPPN